MKHYTLSPSFYKAQLSPRLLLNPRILQLEIEKLRIFYDHVFCINKIEKTFPAINRELYHPTRIRKKISPTRLYIALIFFTCQYVIPIRIG